MISYTLEHQYITIATQAPQMSSMLASLHRVDRMLASCAGGKVEGAYAVLWHKSAEALAQSIIALDGNTKADEQAGHATKRFERIPVTWERWDNGADKITIDGMHTMDGYLSNRDILFIASFRDNADTLSQFHLLHYICLQLRPASVTVVLPYIPVGTMERIVPGEEGIVPAAATLASMFNGLPFNPGVRVMTYEIHALPMMFYYQGQSGLTAHSAIPALLKEVGRGTRNSATSESVDSDMVDVFSDADTVLLGDNKNYSSVNCIAFPDDGAQKRFSESFKDFSKEIVVCAKQHSKDKTSTDKTVVVESGDPAGKHVLIVDDMTRSGSTLFRCMEAVVGMGATKVSMFVTHGDFTDEFWVALYLQSTGKGGKEFNSNFDAFYTTDSVSGLNKEFILKRLGASKNMYVGNLTRMLAEGTGSPFDKMKHDFGDIFDSMPTVDRGKQYQALQEWADQLPRFDVANIESKLKIIPLAESIVRDL